MSKTKMKIQVRQARIGGRRQGLRVVYMNGNKVVASSGVLQSHREVRLNIAAVMHEGFAGAPVVNLSTVDIELDSL